MSWLSPANVPWPFVIPVSVLVAPDMSTVAIPGRQVFDTGFDCMNTGVVIFRGLQGASGGQFGASLQVKVVAGLEVAPIPSQGDAVFAERPAPYEPRALEAYYKMCLELKGVYPARFNSFEDILGAIGDVAKKVWGNIEPTVVSGLSGLANSGLGLLTNAIQSRVGMLGGRGGRPPMPMPARVTYRAPSAARSASTIASTRPTARAKIRARK